MNRPAGEAREQLVALLPRMRRFARALSRNANEADDLVQRALARARVRQDHRPPGMPLDHWMLRILKTTWTENMRSRRQRGRVPAPEEPTRSAPDAASMLPLERLSLTAAMEHLPDEQRLAVALVLIEGLGYQDAADVLELPVETVTRDLARGREALDALLAARDGGPS